MHILVNSDNNIQVDARVVSFVRDEAARALGRFRTKLTRVECHLSDVNSHKFAVGDKRCLIEARPAGGRPVVVIMHGANVRSAVTGSLSKLQMALERRLARTSKAGGSSIS
jgi:hypothetical protein